MGTHAVSDRQHERELLAGLAAKTLTKIPALNGRVEKACKLVLGADVTLHPDGTALVNSLTDPTRAYQVTGSPAPASAKTMTTRPSICVATAWRWASRARCRNCWEKRPRRRRPRRPSPSRASTPAGSR